MKAFLPWLLVPLAAWLGDRGAPVPSQPATNALVETAARSWITEAGTVLAEEDFAELLERLEKALTEPHSHERDTRMRLICARLAELDPAAGLEFLAKMNQDLTWKPRVFLLCE